MYSNEQLNAIHFSKIGFKFDFLIENSFTKTKEELSKALNKKIRTHEYANFTASNDIFKLYHNEFGVPNMISLYTGLMPFPEAKIILSKTLKWIRENGSTNDKCSLHVNISFPKDKLGPHINVLKLDINKFILNFDEEEIYDKFKNRKDSVYAKSIKSIIPLNINLQPSLGKNSWKNHGFINDSFYAVDFSNMINDYVVFKYIGGTNYEKKYASILSLIEHFIISLFNVLNNPTYTKEDNSKLNDILNDYRDIIKSYKKYDIFEKKFPKISLMIDLKTSKSIIELYYPKIRERVFHLITRSGMTSGLINYDSDSGKIQIKDALLDRCFEIMDVDIFESKIRGNIKRCDIFESDIEDSYILESNVFTMSTCNDSKIQNCYISKNVEVNNCYIFGEKTVFSGNMNGGVFKEGRTTKLASFSDNTEIVNMEKIKM